MTHKEMAAHLRKRLKIAGIKARVAMSDSCGQPIIHVFVPAPYVTFTENEQRVIRHIADCNKLTRSRGEAIDVERMTDPMGMRFEFHASAYNTAAEAAHA